MSGADVPYDWDRYELDFRPSPAYAAQAEAVGWVLTLLEGDPAAILEVGPGLGRITRLLTERWPRAEFGLWDVSEAAIEKTSAAIPTVQFTYGLGEIQRASHLLSWFPFVAPGGFDLVVAVEVLMHVPPDEVEAAIGNLLRAIRPGGYLLSCDWTQPTNRPVRVSNYCHDYAQLYGKRLVAAHPTGAQTVFLVRN